eukprot:TRINITY_DN420_c0_g4_i2.p2 TRINITY_DN420_c0_g4~~TRINITY_DN420_c0_g4_i2.p2  ORF type:complete len:109 (-),score=30.81 TRINITY_DN420_c0_g4_i2:235-561(-)
MVRSSLLSVALLAVVALVGLRSAFVPSPAVTPSAAHDAATVQQGAIAGSAGFLAAVVADPAFAESMDSAEVYQRKILTAGSYALIPVVFLFGLIIAQARRLVENKWLA